MAGGVRKSTEQEGFTGCEEGEVRGARSPGLGRGSGAEVGSPPVLSSGVSGSDQHFEKIPLAVVRGPLESDPSARGRVSTGTGTVQTRAEGGLNCEGSGRWKGGGMRPLSRRIGGAR